MADTKPEEKEQKQAPASRKERVKVLKWNAVALWSYSFVFYPIYSFAIHSYLIMNDNESKRKMNTIQIQIQIQQ